jgi:hypothetical protein
MRKITEIRKALDQIPNSRKDFKPEDDFLGNQKGIQNETIYSGEATPPTVEHLMKSDVGSSRRDDQREENERALSGAPSPEVVVEFGAAIDDKGPLLKGTEGERIKKSVEIKGMDAFGCYLSFHVNRAQWGIYISTSGIAYMVDEVFKGLTTTLEVKCQLAVHSILNHELFHFAADYMVAQLEMMGNEPAWLPMKVKLRNEEPHYLEREEKLANFYMLRHLRSGKSIRDVKGVAAALRRFVRKQPSGYRDGAGVRQAQLDSELALLANDYFGFECVTLSDFPIEWSVLYPLRPRVDWRYCPIHVIHDEHRLNIPSIYVNLFTKIENLRESAQFKQLLKDLPKQIQLKWEKKFKRAPLIDVTPGMDFKQWKQSGNATYSVRVDASYRAHLQFDPKQRSWTALTIGNHAAMGHG